MKRKIILTGLVLIIFIFLWLLIAYQGFKRKERFLENAGYIGTCSVCRCQFEIPAEQINILRHTGQAPCLICKRCKRMYN